MNEHSKAESDALAASAEATVKLEGQIRELEEKLVAAQKDVSAKTDDNAALMAQLEAAKGEVARQVVAKGEAER